MGHCMDLVPYDDPNYDSKVREMAESIVEFFKDAEQEINDTF